MPVPTVLRERADLVGLELGRIVDEKGQRTQGPDRLRYKALDRTGIRKVGSEDGGLPARLSDAECHFLRLVGRAATVDRHRIAFLGEAFDDSPPDALRPA